MKKSRSNDVSCDQLDSAPKNLKRKMESDTKLGMVESTPRS